MRRWILSILGSSVLALSLISPAFAAGGPGGGGGGGGETTLGNNLSVPAIFVPGSTTSGAPTLRVPCASAPQAPTGAQSTDYPGYWLQGTEATWSATCAEADTATVTAQWGSNLTDAPTVSAGKPIRVEVGLLDMSAVGESWMGYKITNLTPTLEDRNAVYGTDGSTFLSGDEYGAVTRVWGPNTNLAIRNLDTGAVTSIPMTAEINSSGAVVYGYNWGSKGSGKATPAGTYLLTFTIDPAVTIDGVVAGGVNSPFLPAPHSTSIVVTVSASSGGGGGEGGGGVTITSANSTSFTAAQAGSYTVTATGTPAPKLTEVGTLPSGVTFTDHGDGTATLAGVPAAGTEGTYPLTIIAWNGTSATTQSFTLTVAPVPASAPQITSAAATTFKLGQPGTFDVAATGYPVPKLTASGTLPTGVTFTDHGDGTATIAGTPTGNAAVYQLQITAANGVLPDAVQSFALWVSPVEAPGQSTEPAGYWLAASDGGIFTFGPKITFYGSLGNVALDQPIVGMAAVPGGRGYWLVASDGGVFAFGDAGFYGSLGGVPLDRPIVGMATTHDGHGYWLVASDGGVFAFGDARYFGSTGGLPLNKPVVGVAPTPSGHGYWLAASDGGVFAFGDARYFGSTGGLTLNKPVVGIASPDNLGYWLVASDGGIFAFGDAPFYGSTGGVPLNKPVVGMAENPATGGYWLVASDGGVFSFNTPFYGSTGGITLNQPIVGMASAA